MFICACDTSDAGYPIPSDVRHQLETLDTGSSPDDYTWEGLKETPTGWQRPKHKKRGGAEAAK